MGGIRRKAAEAAMCVQHICPVQPDIGIILGSGLGSMVEELRGKVIVPYKDIPHFPQTTVVGHAGQLVIGKWHRQQVVCFQGRIHYYEGYSMSEVTFPVRLLAALGAKNLFITNAAGGISSSLNPGDIMLITDHINFMGANPLTGVNDDKLGQRFPSLASVYDRKLASLLRTVADKESVSMKEGVYIGVAGPNLETPAELGAFASWGADAVGMSTVPEVIVAGHAGLKVLAISVITNLARVGSRLPIKHEQVLEVASKTGPVVARMLAGVCMHL
jgi:purine-nucleoside phosphorylase